MTTKPKKTRQSVRAARPAAEKEKKSGVAKKPFKVRASAEPSQEQAKYELSSPEMAHAPAAGANLGVLPSGYGSDTLYLVARDPEWLFAYWDIDWTTRAADISGPVELRLLDATGGGEFSRQHVQPRAHNWYLPAPAGAEACVAEIGWESAGKWHPLCRSGIAPIPGREVAGSESAEFATLPLEVSFQRMLDGVREAVEAGKSLAEAVASLQRQGASPAHWSADQKKVLEALLGDELFERISLGSGAIEKSLRRRMEESLRQDLNSESASLLSARLARLAEFGESSLSSGIGASWSGRPVSAAPRGFFMHVNAEVIFYGGTDPQSTVWIDGKEIALQPDGTFRHHFILPDGDFEIPIVARSPDHVETRSATLSFRRATRKRGEVTDTPQPPLGPPMGRK